VRSLVRYVVAVVLAAGATAALALGAAPQIGAILTAHHSTASLPDLSPLDERSVMYDVTGNVMQTFSATENRKPVSIKEVPKGVIDAVLAVEDAGFYYHHGVNLRSLVRAAVANVSAGNVVQGGSTITQQVVKLGLVGTERTANRKIREAMYALQLEHQLPRTRSSSAT
jgi:membrane peptidoglycan carboxypeptidase